MHSDTAFTDTTPWYLLLQNFHLFVGKNTLQNLGHLPGLLQPTSVFIFQMCFAHIFIF